MSRCPLLDPSYPDRGYFWGGENASDYEFVMTFRIPDDLVGLETIIQWKYVDASECNPPGYSKYFRGQNSKNELLPDTFWSADNLDCKADKLAKADTDDEHYWNSAEVTIVKKNELDRKSDQVRRIQNEFPSLDHVIGLDDSHLLPKSTSTLRFNSLRGSSYISPEDKDAPPHDH